MLKSFSVMFWSVVRTNDSFSSTTYGKWEFFKFVRMSFFFLDDTCRTPYKLTTPFWF